MLQSPPLVWGDGMRWELLAATALTGAFAASVWPGDASAQVGEGAYDWGGFYAGAAAGVNFRNDLELQIPDADTSFDSYFQNGALIFGGDTASGGITPTPFPDDFDFNGRFNVGALAGYNVQIRSIVFGLESDISWLSEARKTFTAVDIGTNGARTTELEAYGGVDALFTLRPRVGVAVTERLLLFGTGGLAIGHASVGNDATISEIYDGGKSANAIYSGEDSSLMVGFAAGGGAEYAVNDHVRVRLEGLYYDLGSLSATVSGSGSEVSSGGTVTAETVQPYDIKMDMNGVVARLGVTVGF